MRDNAATIFNAGLMGVALRSVKSMMLLWYSSLPELPFDLPAYNMVWVRTVFIKHTI